MSEADKILKEVQALSKKLEFDKWASDNEVKRLFNNCTARHLLEIQKQMPSGTVKKFKGNRIWDKEALINLHK